MGKYKFRFLVPLVNFQNQVAEIELAKDFIIRKISDYEEKTIKDLIGRWPNISFGKFLLECIIFKKSPEPKPAKYINEGRSHIEKALTILRLYKEGIIGFNLIIQPLAEQEPYGYTMAHLKHYQQWLSPDTDISKIEFKVYVDEIDKLKEFFSEYIDYKLFEKFNLAITYFNKSYIEPYTPRDSLIDLLISLENLYLRGVRQELGYKLSMRVAHNLANESIKRKEIFNNIKEAYDFRSKVVHGEKAQEKSNVFLLKIREYTRKSLKIFVKNPALISGKKLDEIVLSK